MSTAALMHPGSGDVADFVTELTRGLERGGQRALLLTGEARVGSGLTIVRYRALPEAWLGIRKFAEGLGRVPGAAVALRTSRPDIVHAFSPADGVAAALWAGAPLVLTLSSVPRREELAARRLRLATLMRALRASAAVVAPNPAVRDGLRRWLAVDAQLIPPAPLERAAEAYAGLYRRVLAQAESAT